MNQMIPYDQRYRQTNKLSQETRVKLLVLSYLDSKFVTILMTLVTVFALIGVSQSSNINSFQDDIRVIATEKSSDIYFFSALTISFVLFIIEVLTASIVVDDFKYSFFFYLDIVATLSLINDIPWMLNQLYMMIGQRPDYEMVNAIPGVMYIESTASGKIAQVLKSLRLIRLIRIIKLYKYFLKSKALKEKKQIAQAEAKKRKVQPLGEGSGET